MGDQSDGDSEAVRILKDLAAEMGMTPEELIRYEVTLPDGSRKLFLDLTAEDHHAIELHRRRQ